MLASEYHFREGRSAICLRRSFGAGFAGLLATVTAVASLDWVNEDSVPFSQAGGPQGAPMGFSDVKVLMTQLHNMANGDGFSNAYFSGLVWVLIAASGLLMIGGCVRSPSQGWLRGLASVVA